MASRKGSPNRNKQFLLNRLKDMYGDDFEPVMQMAEAAHKIKELVKDSEEVSDWMDLITSFDKVAAYTNAKLKSVEMDANVNSETFEDWLAQLKRQE